MNPAIFIFTSGLLAVLVPYCRGSCFVVPARAFRLLPGDLADKHKPGCNYEGQEVKPGGVLTRNCLKCYCSRRGDLYCCDQGIRITEYPADCRLVMDETGCSQRAVKIYNENEECVEGISAVV